MISFVRWKKSFEESPRREMVRSRPQLEALEGRALLAHAPVSPTGLNFGAGLLPSTLVSANSAPVASAITPNGSVQQPFVNTVLSNGFARELARRNALPALFNFVGQRAGEPGYLPFLDRNRDGVITRSEVVVLAAVYHPPFHLLRVS
jgi:hypothetical protein